jgi:hypothetical protein
MTAAAEGRAHPAPSHPSLVSKDNRDCADRLLHTLRRAKMTESSDRIRWQVRPNAVGRGRSAWRGRKTQSPAAAGSALPSASCTLPSRLSVTKVA